VGRRQSCLREPSGEAWLRWQEVVKAGAEDENVSVSEKAHRNLCADVVLFIDVLCDTDKQPVFSAEEEEQVREIYGPIHSRLLQALDLINNAEEAREKSQPRRKVSDVACAPNGAHAFRTTAEHDCKRASDVD
jgi:hypothetical protein